MESEQGTVEGLIERARRGDHEALTELWRLHRRWVAAIVLAHRPRAVEVEDLMQEVAVKLIDRLDTLRDPVAFRPWLRRIAINICRGAARSLRSAAHFTENDRTHTINEHGDYCVPPPSHDAVEQEAVDCHDEADRLMRQVMTLPPEYREPLLLRSLHSMSYQQISAALGLPVTTIETRLARARRIMREELGPESGRNGSIV